MTPSSWPLFILTLFLVSCVTPSKNIEHQEAPIPQPIIDTPATAPPVSRAFPADTFRDLLIAEFAVRYHQYDIALDNYIKQAHITQDIGVTSRATRLAQFLKVDSATLEGALLWLELEPNNIEAHYTAAMMQAKNHQPIEALSHMEVVLNHEGKSNFAAIAASTLKAPKAQQLATLSAIEKLITLHPEHSQLYIGSAIIKQSLGELEQALKAIQQAIQLDGNDLQAVLIETSLLPLLGKEDQALSRLQQTLQEHPESRRIRLQYARILLKKDIKEAITQFEILLAESPDDGDLILSLALIHKELNHTTQAQQYFEQLLNLNTRNDEAHFYLAQLAEHQRDIDAAISHYSAISFGKDYLAASNRIAELYASRSEFNKAQIILRNRRLEHPDLSPQLYIIEVDILLKLNQIKAGYSLLNEALTAHPNYANLLYLRSMVNEKIGKTALMEADLRHIIQQDANHVSALNALGYVLANRSENLDEAYNLIHRALALKPQDPAILDSLGWVEYRRGNLSAAHRWLEKAYQQYPDPEVAAHFGEVLWQLQEYEKAIHIWQTSLDKNPNSIILKETMHRMQSSKPIDTTRNKQAVTP